jgi:uncharacterized OB-fold protein
MGKSSRVMSMYDVPMWESIENREWKLQKCCDCGKFRYPPSPICPDDHSMDYEWVTVSGEGTILSWTVFHRQYFDDFPPPYNVIAVRLKEGPIVVSNLVGGKPAIGMEVTVIYESGMDGLVPRFRLLETVSSSIES